MREWHVTLWVGDDVVLTAYIDATTAIDALTRCAAKSREFGKVTRIEIRLRREVPS